MARGLKEDPHRWENMKYKSTQFNPNNRHPMKYIPTSANRRNFFSYINISGNAGVKEHDTTITHEVVQEIISELKEITFEIKNRDNEIYKIYVSECEKEELVRTSNGNYFVDVMLRFNKSEPEYLVSKWKGKLAVEVWVKHKTKQSKINDLQSVGIPIIQFRVSEKLKIREDLEYTEEEVKEKKEFIRDYYKEVIYAKLIGDYESEEYKEMVRIAELEQKVDELKAIISKQSSTLQQCKQYMDNQKAQNESLTRQLNNNDREITLMRNELETIKKSIWYKISKAFKK